METIDIQTAEMLIMDSLQILRVRSAELNELSDLYESVSSGGLSSHIDANAIAIRRFQTQLSEYRSARAFFFSDLSLFSRCANTASLNISAVRAQLKTETGLEYSARLAEMACEAFMFERRADLRG